jgi:predicted GNAT family N-acyltransferase
MDRIWKQATDGLLKMTLEAPIGGDSIFKNKADRDWFETFLLRAVGKANGAKYHCENVQSKISEIKRTYTKELSLPDLKHSGLRTMKVTVGGTHDAAPIAFEVEAFLVACRSALDFVGRMLLVFDSGFDKNASIKTLLKKAETDQTWDFSELLQDWKEWIFSIRGYRDAYTHYRTLRSTGGFKTVREGDVTTHAVIPFLISERVLPDQPDTVESRLMSDESDFHVGEVYSRAEMRSEGTGRSVIGLQLEFVPAPGYIPVEQFCQAHLQQLEEFLRDAFRAMTERGHWRHASGQPVVRTCRPADLGRGEIDAFVGLVSVGGAVRTDRLKDALPLAEVVVLLLIAKKVVGVGTIKANRPRYAESVSRKSGFGLPSNVRELGYVAVSPAFRGRGFSKLIVSALTDAFSGYLFATTSSGRMQRVLGEYGFARAGDKWPSVTREDEELSLWVRRSVGRTDEEAARDPK